jgi:uncharacterized protein
MTTLRAVDPLAISVVKAIRSGDVAALERLLAAHPDLATATIDSGCAAEGSQVSDGSKGSSGEGRGSGKSTARSLLHVATDWPGHFPNGAAVVAALIRAGTDVNARFIGPHTETPLHWAASSDDTEVLDALLDGGADIEADGAVIAGGTPLDDAVAFGQWRAAHRLVERGAQTALWHAAALGLMDRVEASFAGTALPARHPWGGGKAPPITIAFWCACHGGQRRAAEFLLERGAELNWVSSWDRLSPLGAAKRSGARELVEWLRAHGAMG